VRFSHAKQREFLFYASILQSNTAQSEAISQLPQGIRAWLNIRVYPRLEKSKNEKQNQNLPISLSLLTFHSYGKISQISPWHDKYSYCFGPKQKFALPLSCWGLQHTLALNDGNATEEHWWLTNLGLNAVMWVMHSSTVPWTDFMHVSLDPTSYVETGSGF